MHFYSLQTCAGALNEKNEVTREIRYAKLNYQNKKIVQINSGNIKVKEWYKLTKQLFNKQSLTTIPTLKYQGKTASDDIDKVNLLNTVFCKQVTIDFNHLLYPLKMLKTPSLW